MRKSVKRSTALVRKSPGRPWQPGQSGNPKGGPKGPQVRTLLGRALLARLEAGDPSVGLDPAYLRIVALLKDPDTRIRAAMEKFLFLAQYGATTPTPPILPEGNVLKIIVQVAPDWSAPDSDITISDVESVPA